MKLRSMKRKVEEGESCCDTPAITSGAKEEYPWGLRITLNNEELLKLGIDVTSFAVYEIVGLTAKAKVTDLSSGEDADGARQNVSLQITSLAISEDAVEMGEETGSLRTITKKLNDSL